MPRDIKALPIGLLLTPLFTQSSFAQNDPDWCDPYIQGHVLAQEFRYGPIRPIAISGNTFIQYSPFYNDESEYVHAIDIYTQQESRTWNYESTIVLDRIPDHDWYDVSLDIDDDTVIFGVTEYDVLGTEGAVFVYTRINDQWKPQDILTGAPISGDEELFGSTIAIDNDTIIVGAPSSDYSSYPSGAAYIFERSGSNWDLSDVLVPPHPEYTYGFGSQVAISNQTAVVGLYRDIDKDTMNPLAYVYSPHGRDWKLDTALYPHDAPVSDNADSIAIDGDTILVGSHNYSDPRLDHFRGAGLVFERGTNGWTHETSLVLDYDSDFGVDIDYLGLQVKIDGNRALVAGAPEHDTQPQTFLVFNKSSSIWTLEAIPTPLDNFDYSEFGITHDLSGEYILSSYDYAFKFTDDKKIEKHEPVIFDFSCDYTCYADLNNDNRLDFFDFTIFRNAFMAHDPLADFYQDGNINFYDLVEYMIQFNRGFYKP